MGHPTNEVLERLPQKDPFLFVDSCVERTEKSIKTRYQVTGEEDFFKGHFPGRPIMPGVLLQEAMFQSGSLLMSYIKDDQSNDSLGVVSRVSDVKFKNFVVPGNLLEMEVTLDEEMANAFFMSGKMRVDGKVVMVIKFTGASVPSLA